MTKWGRHRATIAVLLAATAAAGCGGGGAPTTTSRAAVTSMPASTRSTTSTTRPGASSPPVVDRGADAVAIVRSLLRYGRWLERDHPDPALVDRAYAWGTELARGIDADLATLRRTGRRVVEVDDSPPEFVVVSRLAHVVSFRVTEHLARRDLVDTNGRVLDHVGPATEHYVVLLHRFSADDPWRLSAVDRQQSPVEVRL